MSKKKKLIPELRFPEFKSEGEWTQIPIGNVLLESRIPSKVIDPNKRITVRLNQKGIEKREFRGTEAEDATYFFVRRKGQFIYGKQNLHKGAFGIIPDELDGFESSQDIPAFDFKKGSIPEYFVYYLSQEEIYPELEKISIGTGSKRIHPKELFKVEFPFPSKPEQQKIAICLSSLDEVIAAHSQKLELLKCHKKGLMQNLFPQGGEKVPKLRFEEFRKDAKWAEKKLEGLAKRGSGHTPNKQMSNYYDGGIKWVSLADSSRLDKGYIYETKNQISKEGIENSSAVLHPAGTVILSRDAGVGKSAVLYSEMAVSQHFIVWTCNESKLFNWYLYYVLQLLKPAFEGIAVGSTIKTIGLPYFKELVIPVPSINEQKKIAFCLSSLDELITAQMEKIEQLKEHKKGLMQGLFPKKND